MLEFLGNLSSLVSRAVLCDVNITSRQTIIKMEPPDVLKYVMSSVSKMSEDRRKRRMKRILKEHRERINNFLRMQSIPMSVLSAIMKDYHER